MRGGEEGEEEGLEMHLGGVLLWDMGVGVVVLAAREGHRGANYWVAGPKQTNERDGGLGE